MDTEVESFAQYSKSLKENYTEPSQYMAPMRPFLAIAWIVSNPGETIKLDQCNICHSAFQVSNEVYKPLLFLGTMKCFSIVTGRRIMRADLYNTTCPDQNRCSGFDVSGFLMACESLYYIFFDSFDAKYMSTFFNDGACYFTVRASLKFLFFGICLQHTDTFS